MEIKVKHFNPKLLLKQYWALGIVLVLTIISFSPILKAGFVNLDDNGYIYENPDIVSGGITSIVHLFTRFYVGHYLPFTMLSFKIEYLVFGLHAPGYHFINLLLHLSNICLVYVLLLKVFRKHQIALVVAALFAIHPMHVESVAWISERKDVLYSLFLLISLIYYVRYLSNRSSLKCFYLSLTFFVVSLLSKSAAVILPFLLVLIDLITNRKLDKKLIIEKIPFFAISLIFALLTLHSQDVGGKGSEAFDKFSGFDQFLFAIYAFGFYLVKVFVPSNLAAYHPFPHIQNGLFPDVFYISIMVAVVFFLLLLWQIFLSVKNKKLSVVLFGMLFYLFATSLYLYLPVGRVIVAERFSYLSYIGLFVIFAAIVYRLTSIIGNLLLRRSMLAMLWLIVIVLSIRSYNQTSVWKNGISLWQNVISKYPTNPEVNKGLADAYVLGLNNELALKYYKQAVKFDPSYSEAYYNMGAMNLKFSYIYQAISDFTKAIEIDPKMTDAYINRGNAKAQLKDWNSAIADYTMAIKCNPSKAEAFINRGSSWYLLKNSKNACSDWQIAASLGNNQANEMLLNYCQ